MHLLSDTKTHKRDCLLPQADIKTEQGEIGKTEKVRESK